MTSSHNFLIYRDLPEGSDWEQIPFSVWTSQKDFLVFSGEFTTAEKFITVILTIKWTQEGMFYILLCVSLPSLSCRLAWKGNFQSLELRENSFKSEISAAVLPLLTLRWNPSMFFFDLVTIDLLQKESNKMC